MQVTAADSIDGRDENDGIPANLTEAAASSSRPFAHSAHHIHIQNQRIGGSATVHIGDAYHIALPENIAQEAARLSEVMRDAETACNGLYELIGSARNVPVDTQSISRDLEDLHLVLGTIQASLCDEELREGIVWAALSDNLAKVVESSLLLFSDVTARIKALAGSNETVVSMAGKEARRDGLTNEEIGAVRHTLTSHKITLNMAISMAALYQTNQNGVAVASYRETLELVLQRLEDEKASQLPPSKPHRDIDRAAVRIDYTYPLRHYLNSAASVLTGTTARPPPSMQVSSYLASDSSATPQTFVTAPTIDLFNRCTQIFITGLPNVKTMVLQVESFHTIQSVKNQIRKRLDLPFASFQLVYRKRVLDELTAVLGRYEVVHDSSLLCVSFRPDGTTAGAWSPWTKLSDTRISFVKIKNLRFYDIDVHLTTERDVSLEEVKTEYAMKTSHIGSRIAFVHSGRRLEDRTLMKVGNFTLVDGVCTLFAVFLLVPSKPQSVQSPGDAVLLQRVLGANKIPPRRTVKDRKFKPNPKLETVTEVITTGDTVSHLSRLSPDEVKSTPFYLVITGRKVGHPGQPDKGSVETNANGVVKMGSVDEDSIQRNGLERLETPALKQKLDLRGKCVKWFRKTRAYFHTKRRRK